MCYIRVAGCMNAANIEVGAFLQASGLSGGFLFSLSWASDADVV